MRERVGTGTVLPFEVRHRPPARSNPPVAPAPDEDMKLRFRTIALLAPLLASFGPAPTPQAEFDHSHAKLTAVLESALSGGLVDYAGLRKDKAPLNAYLKDLEATTPAQHKAWTREQRYAFWINAYNAYTIKLIRDEGPVKSIKKLGGLFSSPWEKKFINLPAFDPERKNKKLTLDEIEHEILRPTYKDARVHAAVNCASMGCPPLRGEAFQAERLDEQLDEQVAIWLGDPTVKWVADHVGDEALAKALRDKAGDLKVKYLDYDWGINAQNGKR